MKNKYKYKTNSYFVHFYLTNIHEVYKQVDIASPYR